MGDPILAGRVLGVGGVLVRRVDIEVRHRCWAEQPARMSRVAVHHRDAGLHRRLEADVAMGDVVVVDVLGGEAARAIAVDGLDALAIEADMPEELGRLREGDAFVQRWLHHGELDSVVLD